MNVNDGFVMPTIADSLKKICEENKISDADIILDVYLVCANKGVSFIPDAELLRDIDRSHPNYWSSTSKIAQRKDFLESLSRSPYMDKLIALNDPMKAVIVFVEHIKNALLARGVAKNNRMTIDHNSGSFTGAYAGQDFLDEVARVKDTDISFACMYQGLLGYAEAVESEEMSSFFSSSCGAGRYYDATQNDSGNLSAAVVQHGVALPAAYPAMFDMFTKLSEKLGLAKLKDKETEEERERKKTDRMEDHAQIQSVDPAEIANDTFDFKVANKSLDVKFNQDQEEGLCHLFVLLDVSGSMMANDLGGRVCRAFASNVITLALLQFAMKASYKVWVIPFAGSPNVRDMQVAQDRASALTAMKWLGRQNYDGRATEIEAAVRMAYEKVSLDPTYKKCDIVLITDGCSPITPSLKTDKPERTILRTLFISETLKHYGRHAAELINASDTHKLITWDNKKNELTIGNSLDGISATESTLGPVTNETDEEED